MISIKEIKKVLSIQATAIRSLEKYIGTSYEKAVEAIYRCKGKLVITGIGKSGIVAQKISATFSSTGTPSIFLHPVEAMHGNIGILHRNDLVLAIGKSGESEPSSMLSCRNLSACSSISATMLSITDKSSTNTRVFGGR